MNFKITYLHIITITNIVYYFRVCAINSIVIVQNDAQLLCVPEYLVNCSAEVKHPGTTKSSINGQGTAIKVLPRETRVRIAIQKQLENKNISFGNPIEHNACDYIKNDKLFYPGFLKYGNFPRVCPLIAQTYIINDYQVPIKDLPPIIAKGRFIATFQLMLKNIPYLTLYWYGELK